MWQRGSFLSRRTTWEFGDYSRDCGLALDFETEELRNATLKVRKGRIKQTKNSH